MQHDTQHTKYHSWQSKKSLYYNTK